MDAKHIGGWGIGILLVGHILLAGCAGDDSSDNSLRDQESRERIADSAVGGKNEPPDSTMTLCAIGKTYIDDGMPKLGPMEGLPYDNREEIAEDVDIMDNRSTDPFVVGLLKAITRYADDPDDQRRDAAALMHFCRRLGYQPAGGWD